MARKTKAVPETAAADETVPEGAEQQFLRLMSHEMRTPLNGVIGMINLLQRTRLDGAQRAYAENARQSAEHLLGLVNDLLDVAKIESAVGTIHLERTDLRPLLRGVLRELDPLINAKRLTIELRLPAASLSTKVDPFRFQQVMRNVLANAIRFSPVGELIQLGARHASDHSIHVWVRDQGPGIPASELEDIFNAFVQSSKTKDGSGGTGLGLAICRKILDAHRGTISARNVDGGGACFDILLPPNDFTDTMPGVLTELV